MPFNDTYANNILNYLFAKVSTLTIPSAVYIGLSTNDPEADKGSFTELSGNGYHRVLISQKGETYPNLIGSASGRSITNPKQINWTKATGGDWATAQGFGLFSSETGGTPFFYGKLENPIICVEGAVALFDPNALKISIPDKDVDDSTVTTSE